MAATDQFRQAWLHTPLRKDRLLFAGMTGVERLSAPFQFDLSLLSAEGDVLTARDDVQDDLLGKPMAVAIQPPSASEPRFFHGIVTEFSQVGYGERFNEYHAVLRPWFWLLTRTADCRIFQNKSVVEIFEAVVKEYGFADFDVKSIKSAGREKLEYCVQYRETDFNFLSRLLEQSGIHYFFKHTTATHTMVLVEQVNTSRKVSGYDKVPYYPPTATEEQRKRDHLTSWLVAKSVQPGAFATTDYDFQKPGTAQALLGTSSITRVHEHAKFEIFDFPAESAKPTASDSEAVAKLRIEELQSGYRTARGEGSAIGITPGHVFALTDYPRGDFNIEYYVTAASYSLASNAHETGKATTLETRLAIDAVDSKTHYRPPRLTPKPVVQGAQTAVVVGKLNDEIYTDKYGRVKVQFHWDRYGKRDENSSCWIRVAQMWAGKQWGAIHIPRVGQEVIVSFLEGDPDRPIVTGRVYNGDEMPPYGLPGMATQSGIKTRSTEKGSEKNFNEIRFEDKKGSEEIVVHAEKDLKVNVENDATWMVGLDEDSPATNKKGNAKLVAGKTIRLEAGDEITFETGESRMVMKKDGVITITCKKLVVKATDLIDLDSKQNIKAGALQKLELEGKTELSAKSLKVAVEGTTAVQIKSSVSTKVEGTMLDLSANGIATLKGALTKIG